MAVWDVITDAPTGLAHGANKGGQGANSLVTHGAQGAGQLPGAIKKGVGAIGDWLGSGGSADIKNPQMQTGRADEERALALQSRGMQSEYGDFLRAAMAGRGPSVAQHQLMQGRDEAIKAAMSTAASARGGNASLAAQQAGNQSAQISQQAARDAAVLRAQEQQAYSQQFGALSQAMRQQDLLSRGYSIDEAQAQLGADTAYMQGQVQVGEGAAGRRQGLIGGLLSGAGGLLSDIRGKQDVQPVGYSTSELTALRQPPAQQMAQPQPMDPMQIDDALTRALERQQAQQAAQQREAPAQGGGGGIGGFLTNLGSSLSDRETKTEVKDLRQENSALLGALKSMSGGVQDRLSRMPTPSVPQVGAPEDLVAKAAAEERARRNEVMGALRKQMGDEAMEAAAVEQFQRDQERLKAQDRRIMNAAEATREGAADIYFREQPTLPPKTPAAGGAYETSDARAKTVYSDRDSKEQISALSKALADAERRNAVPEASPGEMRSMYPDLGPRPGSMDELDAIRDEQVSGIRGMPTKRFENVAPIASDAAKLPPVEFRHKEPYAEMTNAQNGLPPGDEYGHRKQFGLIAGDMKQTDAFAPAIKEDPATGMDTVDVGRTTMTTLAGVGELARVQEQQMDEMEALKKALARQPFPAPERR